MNACIPLRTMLAAALVVTLPDFAGFERQASADQAPAQQADRADREEFVVPEINLAGRREHDRERIQKVQQLARDHPRDPEKIGGLGILYLSENVPGLAAATCFERAIQLAPNDMQWYYYLGYTCARESDTPRAIKAFRRAIELGPDYAPTYALLADLLLETNEPEAARLYEKAAVLNPDLAEAHFGLGRCANLRGDMAAARMHFERSLVSAPKYAAAHYQLALILRKLGMLEDATEHLAAFQAGGEPSLRPDPLKKAIAQSYDPTTAMKFQAMDLLEKGRKDEAIPILKEILELDPESVPTHYNLGLLLAGRNEFEEAAHHLRRAFEIDPKKVDAKSRYGQIMIRLRREDEGERMLREVLEQHPDHALTLARLGMLMNRQGNLEEAVELLGRAAQLELKHATIQYEYGKTLVQVGRYDDAIKQLQIVLELAPDHPEARELLQFAEAQQQSTKAPQENE